MADTAATLGLGRALPVTASFSVPLVVLGSLLAVNAAKTRVECNTWQGDQSRSKDGKPAAQIASPDGNTYDALLIATRVHANLMENLPITLLLAGLAELSGADRKKLTSVLAAFSVMRVAHVYGLYKASQPARALGFFGTNIVQLGLVSWLAVLNKSYWGY